MGSFKGLLGILSLAVAAEAAQQTCNLALQVCPKTLEGTTINVPENVIWLEPKLPFCPEQVQVQSGGASVPTSLVFVIDNSGSMGRELGSGTDPEAARFSVTKTLLDSIYKAAPGTEVGLVIFSRRLAFDHRDNAYFKTAFPGDNTQHDSYVPLTRLDHKFPDGRSGLDSLKALLKTEKNSNGDLVNATKRNGSRRHGNPLAYSDNLRSGTDISLGFQAAKLAIAESKAAKENQYIVFLSDGDPRELDEGRKAFEYDFQNKVAGVPTTFTVFFDDNANPTAPETIVKMTDNIRANGYSTRNPKSAYWAINLPASQLFAIMETNILNPIFTNKAATPASATLVSGGKTLSSSSLDAKSFVFPDRVPLSPTQTSVALTYNYTYTDSGKTKTHTATYNLNIRRTPAGKNPEGTTTLCKDNGDIALLHDGKAITVATADHEKLDVRLTLPAGESCGNCQVKVQPSGTRSPKDSEAVSVAPQTSVSYAGSFGRETSTTPAVNDGKLQHLPGDSIIITWVNPANPLDVIRKAFPYSDVSTALAVAHHGSFSRTDHSTPTMNRKQWILAGSPNVKITTNSDCCQLVPALSSEDSAKYVGIKVTASRSFKVDIKVYSNLGQFVNKVSFSVSQAEFENLAREGTGKNRSLRILWDNRTESGSFAGTGAYVFKTTVTLNKVPGIAEDQVERTEHRRVGVIRTL